jgi:hypothetical protein
LIDAVYHAQLELFQRMSAAVLGPSPIAFDDAQLECLSSDANSSSFYLYGFSNNLTYFDLYARLLSPGAIAVDVGANLGIHTLVRARGVGPVGRVYA